MSVADFALGEAGCSSEKADTHSARMMASRVRTRRCIQSLRSTIEWANPVRGIVAFRRLQGARVQEQDPGPPFFIKRCSIPVDGKATSQLGTPCDDEHCLGSSKTRQADSTAVRSTPGPAKLFTGL